MIAAVILAAGSGTRMGTPKALLELHGETLLQRAVRVARQAGLDPVVAVVGDFPPGMVGAEVVRNALAPEGMASSIRAGLAALPPQVDQVLFLTVDQMGVEADLLQRMMALASPHRPVACAYGGTLGIPALFPVRLFPQLRELRGDRGAKAILLQEDPIPIPFPGGLSDLDTPEDLARLTR